MRWDRLFEDLEGQLASEWEAERAALDAESERLRISRVELRGRLRMLCAAEARAVLTIAGVGRLPVRMLALGADWTAASDLPPEGARAARSMRIVPLAAIRGIDLDHGLLLDALAAQDDDAGSLRERMTLGFVLRDLARRRLAVRLHTVDGEDLHGTIDRAGADHLDLAQHDQGVPRLARAVSAFRIVPFGAIAAVQTLGDQLP
ncbi:hypothetical protein [Microbacterium sp.]|uniref:hypothetical protein n=1 Tax=Microbacterium sp. TaxID=51671 RepID=UPI0039E44C03